VRILLCAPFELDAPRGNSVAARRLADGFAALGHPTRILDRCETADPVEALPLLDAFRPDVLLFLHAGRCARHFQAFRPRSAAPMVVSMRGTDVHLMPARASDGTLIGQVLDGCQAVTVFSDEMRAALHRRWPGSARKVRLIPNGLSLPDSATDYRARLGLETAQPVLVCLAGIRRVKRLPWLVRSLARLQAAHPGLVLLHAGPPLEPRETGVLARLAGAHPWFQSLGTVPHAEVAALLRAGDVYVSASHSEGMPHSVREAMSLGRPLLLSDNPGHRAMAAGEQEALFFRDRATLLAQGGRLLAEPELRRRLGLAARQRVERERFQEREIELYLALFRQLLEPI